MTTAWQLDQAVSALLGARRRVLQDDADLGTDEAAIADALGEASEDVETLLVGAIRGALAAEQRAKECHDAIDRMMARASRYLGRANALRGAAFAAMDVLGRRRLETADFTATVGKGRPGAVVTDQGALPAEYTRVTTSVDKTALAADLREGVVVPGAELANAMPTLTIRTR